MKLNISEGTKNFIYCLLGIFLVLVAFFFGFQQYRQENKQLKAQKDTLETELKELNEIMANQSDYESQIADYQSRIEKYYKEFPALVQARDQILYAAELENQYDSMFINRIEMGEAEYLTGTEGDSMALYKVPTSLECYINYDQLKDFLVKAPEDGTRKAVDEIILTVDDSTGLLVGKIDISMFYMTGTAQEYEPAVIDDVSTGTDNIFKTPTTPTQEEAQQEEVQQETQQDEQSEVQQ